MTLFLQPAFAGQGSGTVRLVKGTVSLQKKGSMNIVPLKIGTKVKPGDTIITGKDSRARLNMVDNNLITVSPDTMFTIEKYEYDPSKFDKEVSLKLLFGKIRTMVKQRYDDDNPFLVKTPSGKANAKGTDFFTSYETTTNTTQVVTFEGSVKFEAITFDGESLPAVQVNAGYFSSNQINEQPLPPAELPKQEIAALKVETTLELPEEANKKEREPASVEAMDHSPVFIADEDLGTCESCTPPPVGPSLDLPGPSPTRIQLPDTEACDSCDRLVEDGNTRVNINLIPDSN